MSFDPEHNRNIDSEDAMHIKRRIDLYMRRTRTSPSRFGREAVGDPRFISDLRNGRELGEKIVARLSAWLDARERQA
jgi:hypothetical protein